VAYSFFSPFRICFNRRGGAARYISALVAAGSAAAPDHWGPFEVPHNYYTSDPELKQGKMTNKDRRRQKKRKDCEKTKPTAKERVLSLSFSFESGTRTKRYYPYPVLSFLCPGANRGISVFFSMGFSFLRDDRDGREHHEPVALGQAGDKAGHAPGKPVKKN
jgi:hypothetical protein